MFKQVLEMLFLVVVFVGVLWLTYLVTRQIGAFNQKRYFNKNMEIIEVLPLTAGQHLCIVKVGTKYYLLSVTQKSQVTYLTELNEAQLDLSEKVKENKSFQSFQEQLLQKMKGKRDDG